MRRILIVFGFLLLPLVGGCGSDGPSKNSAGASDELEGHILFSRFDESTHTFVSAHTIRPDGEGEAEVPMPGPEGGGRWSRSGKGIAVMTELKDHRIGTAIIDGNGKLKRELAMPDETLNMVCTVWSPDDSRLACEAWDETDHSRSGIYSVRASDGGDLVRLTAPPKGKSDLPGDYSPDGKRLLFKRGSGEGNGELMEVDVDGGKPESLPTEPVEDPGRFSPDGKTILTSANGRLLLLHNTGRLRKEIADDGASLFGAVWSPDGTRIAFSRGTSGPVADIYISHSDGSDRRQVTSTPDNEITVEWGAM